MKTKYILSIFSLLLILACSTANSQTNLNLDEFVNTFKDKKGAVLLDVRTPDEWNRGKLEGSTLINFMDNSFKAQVSKLDKKKPIFVYCAVGGRSARASKQLKELGFTQVYNLTDAGFNDLDKKGVKAP